MEIDPTVVQIYVLYSTSKQSMPPPRSGVPGGVYASVMDWIINNRRRDDYERDAAPVAEKKQSPEKVLKQVWTPVSHLSHFALLYHEDDIIKRNSSVKRRKFKTVASLAKYVDAFNSYKKATVSPPLANKLDHKLKAGTRTGEHDKGKKPVVPIRNVTEGAKEVISTQPKDAKGAGRNQGTGTSNVEGANQLDIKASKDNKVTVPNITPAQSQQKARKNDGNGHEKDSNPEASMASASIPAVKATRATPESKVSSTNAQSKQPKHGVVAKVAPVRQSPPATGSKVKSGTGYAHEGSKTATSNKPHGNTIAAVSKDNVAGTLNSRRNPVKVEPGSSGKNVRLPAKPAKATPPSIPPKPTPRTSVRSRPAASGSAGVKPDKPVHGRQNPQKPVEHKVVDKQDSHSEVLPDHDASGIKDVSAVTYAGNDTSSEAGSAAVGNVTSDTHQDTSPWQPVVELNPVIDPFERDTWMRKAMVRRRKSKSESKEDESNEGASVVDGIDTVGNAEAHLCDDIAHTPPGEESSNSSFARCDNQSIDGHSTSCDAETASRRLLSARMYDMFDEDVDDGYAVDTYLEYADVYMGPSGAYVDGEGSSIYADDRDITTTRVAYNTQLVRRENNGDSLIHTGTQDNVDSLAPGDNNLSTASPPQATSGLRPSSVSSPVNYASGSNHDTITSNNDSSSGLMHESLQAPELSKNDSYSDDVGPPPSCALCLSDVRSACCDVECNDAVTRILNSASLGLRNPMRQLCRSSSCKVLDDFISEYDVDESFRTYSSRRFESWVPNIKNILRELGGIEHFRDDGYVYDIDRGLVADIVDWHDMGPYGTYFPPNLVLQTSRDFISVEFEGSDGNVNVAHRELGGWFEPQAMVVLRSRNTIHRDAGWALSADPEGEENVDVEIVPEERRRVDASVDLEDAYLDAISPTTPTPMRYPLWYYVYMKTGFNSGASMRSSTYQKLLNAYEAYVKRTKRDISGDNSAIESRSSTIAGELLRNMAESSHLPIADSLDAISVLQQAYGNMLTCLGGLHSGRIIHETTLHVSRRDYIFNVIVAWSCLAALITIISLATVVSIQLKQRTARFTSTGK
ncbi:hypothetical protein, conserved [Babesia bigemina]|uniref:Uncharacterized protein n=1 Tax=Babesia bigemina TaxID=5866 RepID=A0A061D1S7_BABBI|nr:hypothetical protein, conserved [Babesia bigemina]CDR94598.1 hypothetical protein, conserved [Babesia bigemina]|eukprot:XP_012766784.1 hypothetical protein, conserved [Babesia bigemina]